MTHLPTPPLTRQSHLLAFFGLAFGISWLVWIPAAAASWGWLSWPVAPTMTRLIGAFGPSLAALLLLAVAERWDGLRALRARLWIWRVGLRWYLFVLLWPAALSLASSALQVGLGQPSPRFADPPVRALYPLPPELAAIGLWWLLPIVFAQQLLLSSPLGEELGWRGYALPRLEPRRQPLVASVILGLLWGAWHLPLLFMRGDPLAGTSFALLLLGIVADSILFTWVFNHTRGSLLLALLFHAAIAVTGLFLAQTTTLPLIPIVLKWSVALLTLSPSRTRGRQPSTRRSSPGQCDREGSCCDAGRCGPSNGTRAQGGA